MTPLWNVRRLCLATTSRIYFEYYADILRTDYTLNNPDTLTKYKEAAKISQKVLESVTALCVAGEKIVNICEKGDKLLEEEIAKVYRGKKNFVKGTYFWTLDVLTRLTTSRDFPSHHCFSLVLRHSIHPAHLR